MQRFFLPTLQPAVEEVVSLLAIHNQLRRVLRAQPGTQLVVLDNAGNERLLEVVTVDRRDTTARVVEVRPAPAEPVVAVTLYQCVLKSDKFEWILQKGTELGVTTFVPVVSKRTVARPGRALQSKQARWDAIVREAAEQSERGGLPVVAPAVTLTELLTSATGTRLLPWEEATGSPGLLQMLGKATSPVEAVSILIGPEGGLEADEVEQAKAVGWQVVSLGSRILRAETAALAALAVVTAALGGLGDAPTVKVPAPSKKKAASKKAEAPMTGEGIEGNVVEVKPIASTSPEAAAPADAASSVVSPTVGAA